MSLWDERATCIDGTQLSVPFWDIVAGSSPAIWSHLSAIAQEAVCIGPVVKPVDQEFPLLAAAVPVVLRQQNAGAVLICAVSHEFSEADRFGRFCRSHDLDPALLAHLASTIPPHHENELRALADILAGQIASITGHTVARDEVEDLSSRLADAYEQFHLLYDLNAEMTLSRKTAPLFDRMCAELLATTVIENIAVILNPDSERGSDARCIVAGPLDIARSDLLRLCDQARSLPPNSGPCLVVNDVTERSHLAWAAAWLNQFIFLPLSSKERVFGGMLAINRRDGQGFGSEEVRFVGALAQRASTFLENARLYEDLEKLFMGMLHALVSSIDAKDPYTCGHSQRVAWLSRHIAGLAGIGEAQAQRAYLSGLLHDIGKIGVSENVLRKEGLLTPDEYEEVKRHPQIGANILQGVRQIDDIVPGVLHHHDRYDGHGYPFGLKGDQIPLLGRIVCLADCFDAITSSRTYRRARPLDAARAELQACAGTQFDPALTELLLNADLDEVSRKMARSGHAAPVLAA